MPIRCRRPLPASGQVIHRRVRAAPCPPPPIIGGDSVTAAAFDGDCGVPGGVLYKPIGIDAGARALRPVLKILYRIRSSVAHASACRCGLQPTVSRTAPLPALSKKWKHDQDPYADLPVCREPCADEIPEWRKRGFAPAGNGGRPRTAHSELRHGRRRTIEHFEERRGKGDRGFHDEK
jgi:hypothetical protein